MKTYKSKALDSYFATFDEGVVIMINLDAQFKGTEKEIFSSEPPEITLRLMIALSEEIPFDTFISKLNCVKDNEQYEAIHLYIILQLLAEKGDLGDIMEKYREFESTSDKKIKDLLKDDDEDN